MSPLDLYLTIGVMITKGDPRSKYNDEAVKWRLFDKTVSQVRKAFIDVPSRELNNLIEEAVCTARADKRATRKRCFNE